MSDRIELTEEAMEQVSGGASKSGNYCKDCRRLDWDKPGPDGTRYCNMGKGYVYPEKGTGGCGTYWPRA